MEIHDVIIVGAGPCGLAVAARLREHTPAALFTDEEHRRYQWIQRHDKKMALKCTRSGRVKPRRQFDTPKYDIVVIDAKYEKWMGRWDRLFNAYGIKHLRSHMLWHIDPQDRDSLLAKAVFEGREKELTELKGCVGKEISKHLRKQRARWIGPKQDSRIGINQRDRNDYFNPSRELFADHCGSVVERYGLDCGLVEKETVMDIDFGVIDGVSNGEELFTVMTDKILRYARAVVLAVGPANEPMIPRMPPFCGDGAYATQAPPQACHSMCIEQIPDPIVQRRIMSHMPTNILVVGGGLTSAQITDLAINKGVSKVWHIMRGQIRVKHFDVDLEWMGKFKNQEQARFWSADSDEERLDAIRKARGGGSITPAFHKRLKRHAKLGKLALCEETRLVDARFNELPASQGCGGVWSVTTSPSIEGIPDMDYIYFATGVETDFRSLPYLQSMLRKYPVDSCGAFPCLNEDLMWKDGVPLFMAGRLAALRLGPAAPNLGGAQLSAERIAWGLEDTITRSRRTQSLNEGIAGENTLLTNYIIGEGSKFSCLAE